jgi:quercetin dioxygenase-like cupin family protein
MEIRRSGSQPSGKGPADWFTGAVRIDPLLKPVPPARVEGLAVTFESGARTAWHTHPLGQMLIVTFGRGSLNVQEARLRKSGLATSYGFHPARSTGTALRPPPP